MKNKFFKFLSGTILILQLTISLSAFSQTKSEILTNKNVVEIAKAGLGDDILISKISSSTCTFDLSANALIDLKKQGVSKEVISAMMDKANGTSFKSPGTGTGTQSKKLAFPTIDILNHVHAYSRGIATPLEKAIAASKGKTKMFGYGGRDLIIEIEGATSPVKLSENNADSFLINTGGGNLPDLALFKLKIDKNKRQAVVGRLTVSGPKSGDTVLPIEMTKLTEGLYKIRPTQRLEKGEYFFTNKPNLNTSTSSAEVYAFSIQ